MKSSGQKISIFNGIALHPLQPFILASASPRRLALLAQLGIAPEQVVPAEIDEAPLRAEMPIAYANRVALAKAAAVAALYPEAYVLAADTVVAVGRRILPKAENKAIAKQCLTLLSGRRHTVHTSVVVLKSGRARGTLASSVVRFQRLSPRDIEMYLATGEWQGKAGGYAIQGKAAAYIPWIQGSYSNVVGLPLHETAKLLGR